MGIAQMKQTLPCPLSTAIDRGNHHSTVVFTMLGVRNDKVISQIQFLIMLRSFGRLLHTAGSFCSGVTPNEYHPIQPKPWWLLSYSSSSESQPSKKQKKSDKKQPAKPDGYNGSEPPEGLQCVYYPLWSNEAGAITDQQYMEMAFASLLLDVATFDILIREGAQDYASLARVIQRMETSADRRGIPEISYHLVAHLVQYLQSLGVSHPFARFLLPLWEAFQERRALGDLKKVYPINGVDYKCFFTAGRRVVIVPFDVEAMAVLGIGFPQNGK